MKRTRTALAIALAAFGFVAAPAAAAESWQAVGGPIGASPAQLTDTAFSPASSDLKRIGDRP